MFDDNNIKTKMKIKKSIHGINEIYTFLTNIIHVPIMYLSTLIKELANRDVIHSNQQEKKISQK